jgi:hypothetical protein
MDIRISEETNLYLDNLNQLANHSKLKPSEIIEQTKEWTNQMSTESKMDKIKKGIFLTLFSLGIYAAKNARNQEGYDLGSAIEDCEFFIRTYFKERKIHETKESIQIDFSDLFEHWKGFLPTGEGTGEEEQIKSILYTYVQVGANFFKDYLNALRQET